MPTVTGSGSSNVRVRIVGVTPWNSNEVFAAGANSEVQVYHSTDGGLTWPDKWYNLNASGNFYGGYPNYIKFDNSRVFISHCTRNSSGAWTSVMDVATTIYSGDTVHTHPNDSGLEVDPTDATRVYFDTDWAIAAASCSLSGTWGTGTEIGTNKGIQSVILNDFTFHEYDATNKTLWIAAKSGIGRTLHFNPAIFRSTARPVDWLFPLYPDGAPAYSIAIHPTNPAIVLAGYSSGRVFRTGNGEETNASRIGWSQVFYGGDHPEVFGTPYNEVTISALKFTPSRPNEAYLAGYRWQPPITNGGVYYSADAGQTWTNDYTGGPVNALLVMDNAVWAGVGSEESAQRGLRAKVGLGTWWKPLTGTALDDQIVTGLDGVMYGSRMIVYIVTGAGASTGGVYKGVNTNLTAGGFTNWVWTDVSAGLPVISPPTFNTAAMDPTNPDRAFVAHANCIFETRDGGTNWTTLSGTCVDSHEQVRVLRYDDLLGGTDNGIFAYLPTGPYLELVWSSQTGKVYRLTGSTSVTGAFTAVTWDAMQIGASNRAAGVYGQTDAPVMFFRVVGEDTAPPRIQSLRYSPNSP
jgi:hypothetical protein